MRKKYRNELFQLINNIGLNQTDFELIEDSSTTTLQFKKTQLKFIIIGVEGDFNCFCYQFVSYAPNYPISGVKPTTIALSFNQLIDEVSRWLKYHVKEYIEDENAPDLWSEFKKGNKTLNINQIDFNDKSTFSLDEKKQILMSINELKSLIHKNLQTTQEQQNLVIDRLNYLIEASERLNKFDWKSLAISTLMSITIALSLDTQKGQVLFDLFTKVFSVLPMLVQNQ